MEMPKMGTAFKEMQIIQRKDHSVKELILAELQKEEANNIRNAMEDVGKKSNLSGSDRKAYHPL